MSVTSEQWEVRDLRGDPNGLGDVLVGLRVATIKPRILYILPTKAERFAPLFKGIAPVLFADEYPPALTGDGHLPLTKCHFDRSVQRDVTWLDEVAKPVAFCINCAPAWAHLRQTKMEYWQQLADRFTSAGYAVFQYGVSSNFTPIARVRHEVDLPITILAGHYSKVGRYIGVDTGDMHLALAVGAKCWVARPPSSGDYRWDMWGYTHPRIKYYAWSEIPQIYDSVTSG